MLKKQSFQKSDVYELIKPKYTRQAISPGSGVLKNTLISNFHTHHLNYIQPFIESHFLMYETFCSHHMQHTSHVVIHVVIVPNTFSSKTRCKIRMMS